MKKFHELFAQPSYGSVLISFPAGGIDVFLVPVLINSDNGISLSHINCWGAALWSGLLVSGYTL